MQQTSLPARRSLELTQNFWRRALVVAHALTLSQAAMGLEAEGTGVRSEE